MRLPKFRDQGPNGAITAARGPIRWGRARHRGRWPRNRHIAFPHWPFV